MKCLKRIVPLLAVLALILSMVPAAMAVDYFDLIFSGSDVDDDEVTNYYTYDGSYYFNYVTDSSGIFSGFSSDGVSSVSSSVGSNNSLHEMYITNYFAEEGISTFFSLPSFVGSEYSLMIPLRAEWGGTSSNKKVLFVLSFYDESFEWIDINGSLYHRETFDVSSDSVSTNYFFSFDVPPEAKYFKLYVRVSCKSFSAGSSILLESPSFTLSVTEEFRSAEEPFVSTDNEPSYDSAPGEDLPDLSVNATVSDGGKLSYQWYYGTSPDTSSGTPIQGATDAVYKPTVSSPGTHYFWCEITNSNSTDSKTVTSSPTKITIAEPPTIEDVTYNWGTAPLEFEKGSIQTLHINVPSGLYDSYSYQWCVIRDSIFNDPIEGETFSGFQVPTDTVGVYRYAVILTGQDGDTTVKTMFRTPDIIISEAIDDDSSGSDSDTGISWNWGDSPMRVNQNAFKTLQVNVPISLGVDSLQWYSMPYGGSPVAIDGATNYYIQVPTNKLGSKYYFCMLMFEDGTTFSTPLAEIITVESSGAGSGGSSGGGSGSTSGSTVIDTSGYYDPDKKNNLDLVEWAINAYESGWGYVMGTYGEVLTQDLLDYKIDQYPDSVGVYSGFIQANWLNKRTADCVGLIKGYCWYDPSAGTIGYAANDTPDYSANQLFDWCSETGTIDTLPEIPGLLLWKDGHVGIYIGDGYVIEARGTKYGVIKSEIDNIAWTNWAKIPSITYYDPDSESDTGSDSSDNDSALANIWQTIKNIPQMILDGIKSLFVPDAEAMAAYQDQWVELLSKRFGAIYEAVQIISDFAGSIKEQDAQGTITFPSVTIDLAGTPFTFGGWDVQVVPDGFDFLVEALKKIISIIATLAFVNAMRRKFEGVLGGSDA